MKPDRGDCIRIKTTRVSLQVAHAQWIACLYRYKWRDAQWIACLTRNMPVMHSNLIRGSLEQGTSPSVLGYWNGFERDLTKQNC